MRSRVLSSLNSLSLNRLFRKKVLRTTSSAVKVEEEKVAHLLGIESKSSQIAEEETGDESENDDDDDDNADFGAWDVAETSEGE